MSKKVIIKPLPKDKWHKLGPYAVKEGQRIIKALVDRKTGRYATGLNYEKIYKDDMTESQYYGKLIGVDLDNTFWNSEANMNSKERKESFWETRTAQVVLGQETAILNIGTPLQYVLYKLCEAHPGIANTLREWEEGNPPDATHYIYKEEEVTDEKASKVAMKQQAMIMAAELTPNKLAELVTLLDNVPHKYDSKNTLIVILDKYIESDPRLVIEYMSLSHEDLAMRSMVIEAIGLGIFYIKARIIMYYDIVIGGNVVEAVQFLKNPSNMDIKHRVIAAIQSGKIEHPKASDIEKTVEFKGIDLNDSNAEYEIEKIQAVENIKEEKDDSIDELLN